MSATPVGISIRNSKGQMQTVKVADMGSIVDGDVLAALRVLEAALAAAEPKRGRGRPKGYKCSPETVAAMVAGRAATLAAKRQATQVN